MSRYAFTAVYCAMLNRRSAASEGVFQLQIPANAYVSNFTIAEPETEVFKMAANIPGRNRAVFMLTYEELLQRRLGRYEHVTSLRPLQLVSRLTLDVTIIDHSAITGLEVLLLRNSRGSGAGTSRTSGRPQLPVTTEIKKEKNMCRITFSPNIVQQARISTNGLLGDFVIRYDVQRDMGIGDIQTKEALFTILGDLRPGDHFNFISFSNRVKVWQPGRLVPVTPNNGPTSTAPSRPVPLCFQDYLSAQDASPNSVSLIIFLTDGQPTVGEVQSVTILGNTRSAVQGKFCIFTIGIGNDVDYRLLERMALDNCGMMRRIPEEADASSMLKGFYDEIGTPLLSDIRINYTKDSVQYVTQHLFTNYFNGSEIVIAGKLTNQSAEVAARPGDGEQQRQKHHPGDRRPTAAPGGGDGEPPLAKEFGVVLGSILEDFVERLWGFLSVKEGLRSRLRSQTSREREDHIQQATNLSLTYNFLTPLTNMVVEKPSVLADGTTAPPTNEAISTGNEVLSEPVDPAGPGGRPPTLSNTVGGDEKRPVKKSVTISKTSADGDPHFVVEFPLSKLTVCFNINGEPGHVLRLVSDHKASGVTVNGKLIGAPPPPGSHKHQRTYFSTITVVVDHPKRVYIEVTPKKVILDGRDRIVLPCHSTVTVDSGVLSVSIVAGTNVTVSVGGNISFVILLHQYKNPAPYQRDHLGFYIGQSKGLSHDCHGLLGQFLYEEVGLAQLPVGGEAKPGTVLKVKGRSVPVVQKSRRIYGGAQSVDCWFARNNAAKLIDGQYGDYLRSHMFDTSEWTHGSNGA
ncbi:hypothetical protein fugu_019924 [Takifugu bimaculatus]|uniref:VWFA domain-containing protein n=1 Tax=Takifugu bimaculatus TaxID=433685 RepID=A0A4Z2BGQ9_9TELE|nr:hypothetical protein fugu_019924 [Takifugu bimaculatus]